MQGSAYIKLLISKGESQTLDFKYFISSASKIAKSLVAFANTDGGKLLIGVKDNGNIVGVKSEEELYMIDLAAETYCRPSVSLRYTDYIVDGKNVLEVQVIKSNNGPHLAKDEQGNWSLYIRKDDENILASDVVFEVLLNKFQERRVVLNMDSKEKSVMEFIKQNGQINITQFMDLANIKKNIAEKIISNLITLGMLKIDYTSNGEVYKSI